MTVRPAEQLLLELGISDPRQINLDAIAWHLPGDQGCFVHGEVLGYGPTGGVGQSVNPGNGLVAFASVAAVPGPIVGAGWPAWLVATEAEG